MLRKGDRTEHDQKQKKLLPEKSQPSDGTLRDGRYMLFPPLSMLINRLCCINRSSSNALSSPDF